MPDALRRIGGAVRHAWRGGLERGAVGRTVALVA